MIAMTTKGTPSTNDHHYVIATNSWLSTGYFFNLLKTAICHLPTTSVQTTSTPKKKNNITWKQNIEGNKPRRDDVFFGHHHFQTVRCPNFKLPIVGVPKITWSKNEAIAGHFGDLKVPHDDNARGKPTRKQTCNAVSWGEKEGTLYGWLEGRNRFGPEHLCKYHGHGLLGFYVYVFNFTHSFAGHEWKWINLMSNFLAPMCGRTTKFCGPVASAWIWMDTLLVTCGPFLGQNLPFTGSLQVSVRPTFCLMGLAPKMNQYLAPKNAMIGSTLHIMSINVFSQSVCSGCWDIQCLIGELLRAGHLGVSKLFHPRWRPDELVYLVSPVETWSGNSSNQPKSTMKMHYSPKLVLDGYRRGYLDLYTWD